MLLFAIPNKVWSPMLNPKEREVSSLNGKVGYLCATCVLFPAVWRKLLQFGMITKHTRGWEIDERNLKSMNLTHFHPKWIENLKRSNILVNIRFFAKTSDIRNFSQNIRSNVKTSEVATLNARTVAIGGKVLLNHNLLFMTKHKPPFGCGPPDRIKNYRIIDTKQQPQQN